MSMGRIGRATSSNEKGEGTSGGVGGPYGRKKGGVGYVYFAIIFARAETGPQAPKPRII